MFTNPFLSGNLAGVLSGTGIRYSGAYFMHGTWEGKVVASTAKPIDIPVK